MDMKELQDWIDSEYSQEDIPEEDKDLLDHFFPNTKEQAE